MNQDQRQQQKSTLLFRLLLVYAVVLLWGIALGIRLGHLQIFESEDLKSAAEEQRKGFRDVGPKRGEIRDRRLAELAISVQVDALNADPSLVKDPAGTAHQLSPLLSQSAEDLTQKLSTPSRFVSLQRELVPRLTEQVRSLNLGGVFVSRSSQRVYPMGSLGAHVLGFVGRDNEGLAGLEYFYNSKINGEGGRLRLRVDAKRRSYGRTSEGPETEGDMLVLNLDRTIQFYADEVLKKTVEETQALSGTAIVMDPNTGEVLAMASWPTFDPNHFEQHSPDNYRNRAILDTFEPGSTFKLITFSAVLNEGLADLSELIDCRVGTLRLGGKVYREAKGGFQYLTAEEVFAKSSNVGTIKLGLRLSREKLLEYIQRFGFGEETGIDLPGEEGGLLRPISQWSKLSPGALAIGQEIGATPLQMLRAASAIANGGYLVRPYVVRQILSPQGELLLENRPERHRILEESTTRKLKQAMQLVVEQGTGQQAQLEGYTTGGKTGTAQKFVNGRYSNSDYLASFIGFAPLDKPALAAIVVINEPRGKYYGGSVAAPAYKQIMERALIHLRVPEDRPRRNQNQMAAIMEPSEPTSVSMAEEVSPGVLVESVLNQIEVQAETETPLHVIPLPGSLREVPDFTGLSLRKVASECARLNLELKVTGSGSAVGQRPLAGTAVVPGTVCEVFFSNETSKTRISQNTGGQGASAGAPGGGRE